MIDKNNDNKMDTLPIELNAAAAKLGITRQTLMHYISVGKLTTQRIGRMHVITPDAWTRFQDDYHAGRLDDRGRPKR